MPDRFRPGILICFYMKIRTGLAIILLAINSSLFAQEYLSRADELFYARDRYQECESLLQSSLPSAETSVQKAEILWRLARVYYMCGENLTKRSEKREFYAKCEDYANQARALNPSSPDAIIWHSAGIGRECVTGGLIGLATKGPMVINDLLTILDKLGRTDYSSAWEAFANVYYYHPLKSTDTSVNFARKAVLTIPASENKIETYAYLARLLYERNWSSEKRTASSVRNAPKFRGSFKSVVDKYEYFDGGLGADYFLQWSQSSLGSISDRREAQDIVKYAASLYESLPKRTATDDKEYADMMEMYKSWSGK